MKRHDLAWLADILDSAMLVREFVDEVTFEKLEQDVMLHSAVIRQLEIMGEAAKHVSDAYKASHPEIAWKQMAGMRDVLIHAYHEVDLHEVWRILNGPVPELIRKLEPLVPPIDEQASRE
jgi:uncharacterized protein with HEPN domain